MCVPEDKEVLDALAYPLIPYHVPQALFPETAGKSIPLCKTFIYSGVEKTLAKGLALGPN